MTADCSRSPHLAVFSEDGKGMLIYTLRVATRDVWAGRMNSCRGGGRVKVCGFAFVAFFWHLLHHLHDLHVEVSFGGIRD